MVCPYIIIISVYVRESSSICVCDLDYYAGCIGVIHVYGVVVGWSHATITRSTKAGGACEVLIYVL